jgi:hypothetical protein
VALVRKQTIPTEQPPLVGEVNANFAGRGCYVVSATNANGLHGVIFLKTEVMTTRYSFRVSEKTQEDGQCPKQAMFNINDTLALFNNVS